MQAEGEKHAPVLVALAHKHIREAGGVDAQKRHGPRQAHIRQAGAPVPAEHAARLAQIGEAVHGVAVAGDGAVSSSATCCSRKGSGACSRTSRRFVPSRSTPLHREFPHPVHVAGGADARPVEPDVRQRVDHFKAKQQACAGEQLVVCRKSEGIGAVLA